MKIKDLKEQLEQEINKEKMRPIKHNSSVMKTKKANSYNMKIIGVTGSSGKSTTCYLIHSYLKSINKKSVLYSSIQIDSPYSIINNKESCELPITSKEDLLAIINEAISYNAEYLVLEINDKVIEIVKDLDFDIKVLTNINPFHNTLEYNCLDYVRLKESFLKQNSHTNIIGLFDYDKQIYNELMSFKNNTKSFTTKYITKIKDVLEENHCCLLESLKTTTSGMNFSFRLKDARYALHTNMINTYNVFNILCSIVVLDELGLFNIDTYQSMISNFIIPGRSEVLRVNNRMIIIDTQLSKILETVNQFKQNREINKIRVVIGSIGYGYKDWSQLFNTGLHYKKRHEFRKYACDLINKVADKAYLTESDNGKESVNEICQELKSYLTDIQSVIIVDRKEAIKKAIVESDDHDIILIVGRGNRRVLCNSENTIKLIKDSEAVNEVLKQIGW